MSSGRYEAASQFLTADARAFFAFGISLAALGSQFTGGKLGSMPAGRIEITREVIRGDTAEVEGTFRYADGTVEPIGFNTLVKENGQWKIALDLFGTGSGSSGSSPIPGTSSTSQGAPRPAGSPTTAPGTSSASPNVSTQAGSQALETPGDVARQFFVLTSRGNYEAAAALMTDEAKMLFAFGAFLTSGLSGLTGEEAGFKPIAEVEITREVVQGDSAEVECTLHYADGSVDPVGSVALARENGQWKIAVDLYGSGVQTRQTPALPPGTSSAPASAPGGTGSQAAASSTTKTDQVPSGSPTVGGAPSVIDWSAPFPGTAAPAEAPVPGPVATGAHIGERAPDFSLQSLSGKEVSLSQFRGRVVILDFWASWCAPCRVTMPGLHALWREVADRGVELVGVSVDRTANAASAYLAANGYEQMVALWESLSAAQSVAALYGVRAIPRTVVIDRDGIVRFNNHSTMLDLAFIEKIAGPDPATATVSQSQVALETVDISKADKQSQVVVVVDPGHGGSDLGASAESAREKDVTLAVAGRMEVLAREFPDLRVVLTRRADVEMLADERIDVALGAGAQFCVALHANAFSQPTALGIETVVDSTHMSSDTTWELAAAIQQALVASTGGKDRGVRAQGSTFTQLAIPAVSTLIGFITAPEERTKLVDPAYQELVARGILQGIANYIAAAFPASSMPGTPADSRAAGTSAAGKALATAILDLRDASLAKIDSDVETIATAFADAKEYWRSQRWADIFRVPLRLIEGTVSILSASMNLPALVGNAGLVVGSAESVSQLLTLYSVLSGAWTTGERLELALDGPTYEAATAAMLEDADATTLPPLGFDRGYYRRTILNHLWGGGDESPVLVVMPTSRDMQAPSRIVRGALAVKSLVANTLSRLAADVEAARLGNGFPYERVQNQLALLSNQISRSKSVGTGEVRYEMCADQGQIVSETIPGVMEWVETDSLRIRVASFHVTSEAGFPLRDLVLTATVVAPVSFAVEVTRPDGLRLESRQAAPTGDATELSIFTLAHVKSRVYDIASRFDGDEAATWSPGQIDAAATLLARAKPGMLSSPEPLIGQYEIRLLAALTRVESSITDIRLTVARENLASCSAGAEVVTALGSIGPLYRLLGEVAGVLNEQGKVDVQVEVAKAANAGGKAALLCTRTYELGGLAETFEVSTRIASPTFAVVDLHRAFSYSSPEGAYYSIPQDMLLSLGPELAALWEIVADQDAFVRRLMAANSELSEADTQASVVVVVDPGHGGSDLGATVEGVHE